MAAPICRNFTFLSSRLSAKLPLIWHLDSSKSNVFISRVCGVRYCSNFKSKTAVRDGEKETEFLGEIGRDMPDAHEPPTSLKLTRHRLAKQYARQGKASGVDPSITWPTQSELQAIIRDEEEWCPSLQQMQAEIAEENRAAQLKRIKREQLIAANMAKMPQMVAEYRKKMVEKRAALREQRAKRNRLLEEAKDKLGYAIDPRSTRFQMMVQEIEKEERKKRKELKRKGIVV